MEIKDLFMILKPLSEKELEKLFENIDLCMDDTFRTLKKKISRIAYETLYKKEREDGKERRT